MNTCLFKILARVLQKSRKIYPYFSDWHLYKNKDCPRRMGKAVQARARLGEELQILVK